MTRWPAGLAVSAPTRSPRDWKRALDLFLQAARKGDAAGAFPASCRNLGGRLARDASRKRESKPEEALRFLRLGGVQGDAGSQFFAGLVLRDWGTSEDAPEMAYWFHAAGEGSPRGGRRRR